MKQNLSSTKKDPIFYLRLYLKWMLYEVKPLCLLLIFTSITSLNALAQNTVTGTVTDAGGAPVPGVNVKIKGEPSGVSTNSNGVYSINVPGSTSILVFSFIGSKTQEFSVSGRSQVNVVLQDEATNLKDIVITGYGSQSRETLTTSIAKLDTRTLENIPYTNVLSALQGSVPGVRVQSVNGQPGAAPKVVLRGGTAINNNSNIGLNNPLYLVDGAIRSDLNDIPADDIESLQVLKDAAATAIYGARASNGVVLVTTKTAKAGVSKISYSYDVTTGKEARTVEYVDARDYIYYARLSNQMAFESGKINAATLKTRLEARSGFGTGNDLTNATPFTTQYLSPANQYKLNEGWESMADPIDPTKTIIFKNTDFQALRMQTAVSHNHSLSASGGTEKANYTASIGYLLGEGTTLTSFYNRLSANLNGGLQLNKALKVNGRVIFSNADFAGPGVSSSGINIETNSQFGALSDMFYRNASMPGSTKYQFEDGTLAPGTGRATGNPHYYNTGPGAPIVKNGAGKVSVALDSKLDILPGLSFKPLVSYYDETRFGRSFQPAHLSGITTFTTSRTTSEYSNKQTSYQADAVLNYIKSLSSHNFEATAGYSYFKRRNQTFSATGTGAGTDLIPTLNASAIFTATSGVNELATEGLFGRITYDYNQKYLVQFTGRYDGASNLGANNRFAFFPGVSLGWNIHKENFWQKMPEQISSVKLRGSYGENGNISGLSDYAWQGLFSTTINPTTNALYNGQPGVITDQNALPNPSLKWETAKTFDAGIDMGLFNNRVSIIFDYFHRVTSDNLTRVNLPTSSGYPTVFTNNGSLSNKGVEFDLNIKPLSAKSALQWSINFNASKVSTKVKKLPFNGVEGNRQGGLQVYDPKTGALVWKAGFAAGAVFNNSAAGLIEGSRLGDMYAFRQLGVYATDAEAAAAPTDTRASANVVGGAFTKFGGDVKWDDIDGNGIINDFDQVYVGNIFPTWTGGFSNYFNYKSFNLAIRTDFTTGHTIFNYAKAIADNQLQGDLMPTRDFIEKSWKKQGDITNTPRYIYQVQGNVTRSSVTYEKGDFLALREVTIGYNLPVGLLRKVKVSSARINLTGSNLHYFTKYSGTSPEEGGPEIGHYPNPRAFTLGTNITF